MQATLRDVDLPPLPPLDDEGEDGGGSDWLELTVARNDIDAHLLIGRLSEEGIDTRIARDRRAPGAWLYGGANPWAPVKILVKRFQMQDARFVLAEIAFSAPAHAVVRTEGRSWKVPALWLAAALVVAALIGGAVVETSRSGTGCDPLVCTD